MNTIMNVIIILFLTLIVITNIVLLIVIRKKNKPQEEEIAYDGYSDEEVELLQFDAQYALEAKEYYINPEKFNKC